MADMSDLYRRFYKPVRKWLGRRCSFNGVDPDDIAQEVFAKLLKYPDVQSRENGRGGYIFRIAANIANDYGDLCVNRLPHASVELLMLNGRDEQDGDSGTVQSERMDPLDALQIDVTPEVIAMDESIGRHVRERVAILPSRVRQCLTLFIMHDLTYKQIAVHLGISPRMVQRDLNNAYETLRQVLP